MRTIWIALGMSVIGAASAHAESGMAQLQGTIDSTISGTATFTETPTGLRIAVTFTNAPPGAHGFHIHQAGQCGDQGNAAGGHYNPEHVPHGLLMKDGPTLAHAGDLGNVQIDAGGSGTLVLTIPHLRLSNGPHSVAGRSLILHEKPDDFGQPTGNAGGRIACGVITVVAQ